MIKTHKGKDKTQPASMLRIGPRFTRSSSFGSQGLIGRLLILIEFDTRISIPPKEPGPTKIFKRTLHGAKAPHER
ncbi:MAG: hypothetical protein H6R42_876 [Nitrospirae bacterium]|nr:hypothetical protein [Nitrospirota bacterium]